jgi:hypothetical protein
MTVAQCFQPYQRVALQRAASVPSFATIDRDGDGSIAVAELTEWFERQPSGRTSSAIVPEDPASRAYRASTNS